MASSRISTILGSIRSLGEPVRASGMPAAARALLLVRWVREIDTPLVVIAATDENASDLAADLETLSPIVFGEPLRVLTLPTWEQSPYRSIAPSIRTRIERIAALSQLASNQPPQILVTTLTAIYQATLPKATLQKYSIPINRDASIESREALVRRLQESGYLQVDPVEDPGTFAVRGDIVDVFAPGRSKPVRIELFGDVIERIREFDPATQRADAAPLEQLTLPPAREVMINAETLALVRERLKARADDMGVPRATRDPILSSIQDGIYPDHCDAWAPFAYATPATLLDHLPESWPLIFSDELGCQQEWDRFSNEERRISTEDALESGTVTPPFEDLFRLNSSNEHSLRSRTKLYLDQLEFADLETAAEATPQETDAEVDKIASKHRTFVRGNRDILSGSKQSLGDLEPKFQLWIKQGFKIAALASTQSQAERIRFLLEERGLPVRPTGIASVGVITLGLGSLSEGFRWPGEGLVILTESEILGTRHARRKSRPAASSPARDWAGLQALSDLSPGDLIVHVDHGIGRYHGLSRLDLSGAPADFLLLEYAGKDKLYLPVYRLNVVQKYAGAGADIALDRLGSQQFAKTKEKVKDAVKKLAVDLVQLYAERRVRPGVRFSGRDLLFQEFEAKFAFDETPDQLKAIDDTLNDMESGKVMDRLVCGDVGYGKTEVAIRAAFRAAADGKQVVVLVPTTVLAHQHEQSFRSRLKDYPFLIESVSRFKSAKEQRAVLELLAQGKLDIVIGTHRLLSRDVKFKDLGLIIVDEEHRFGVEHKEKLKALKSNTHVLTLTATPIPRTLHMALSGLRDISLINTPPVDRLPIRTYVSKYDEPLIKQAIETELHRGGQVFFVHNRVDSIFQVANRIRELVPSALVAVGHGQMGEGVLEEAMISFYKKTANILVCTSIIESGLDLPSANTIIVNRADMFGLAQLYQIRGRVGRGQVRAYAYLLLPAEGLITEDAKRRLEVIQRFVELGSGFSIASHDLEIRGGGDLLGPQQSGHINAVGFDLYTELLDEAIRELENQPALSESRSREPEIKAPFPAFLAETYVPDVHQRLSLYRRLSASTQDTELISLEEELKDRYGELPPEAQNLLWLIRIKQVLKRIGIDTLTVGPERVSMVPGPGSQLDPVRAIALVSKNPKLYQLTPDSKFVATIKTTSLRDLFFELEALLTALVPRS